ncbi:methyltransferase (TIGR00027 family) [Nocardia sp. GAS34]|uniref:class I SAM-dependent methyltransferase n=1 Tax=unclassified Nocardia TaxID=2637762 RepID=UPI003D1F00DD
MTERISMDGMELSRTALMAAAARAAHLLVDRPPCLFEDTVAAALLGDRSDELIAYHRLHGDHIVLAGTRAQVTARARYTETRLAASGSDQYVVLGAGLDTFAYRASLARAVSVFEVDHPGTQQWKKRALSDAGVEPLGRISFVPADFERDDLGERLADHGFDAARPALVSWLGVAMYLTRAAIETTVAKLGRLAPGSELIMEYALPPHMRDETGSAYAEFALPAAADHGEPWRSCYTPDELTDLLRAAGFTAAHHISQRAAVPERLWQRADVLKPADLCRLAVARI